MNSVYIETASRIYAALCAAKHSRPTLLDTQAQIARYSFDAASIFMKEYQQRSYDEQAVIQQHMQQHPCGVMGSDPLEIRPRK